MRGYLCAQRERNGPWVDRSGGWENEGIQGPGGCWARDAASWPGTWLGDWLAATRIWVGSRDQVRLGRETRRGGDWWRWLWSAVGVLAGAGWCRVPEQQLLFRRLVAAGGRSRPWHVVTDRPQRDEPATAGP